MHNSQTDPYFAAVSTPEGTCYQCYSGAPRNNAPRPFKASLAERGSVITPLVMGFLWEPFRSTSNPELTCFVAQLQPKYWVVGDVYSGRSIAKGESRAKALVNASNLIAKMGVTEFIARVLQLRQHEPAIQEFAPSIRQQLLEFNG